MDSPALEGNLIGATRSLAVKIVHGRTDGVVPIVQTRKLDQKLTALGIEHVYVEHEEGHNFVPEESLQFLSDHLRGIEFLE
jgi:predicted esterase